MEPGEFITNFIFTRLHMVATHVEPATSADAQDKTTLKLWICDGETPVDDQSDTQEMFKLHKSFLCEDEIVHMVPSPGFTHAVCHTSRGDVFLKK